MGGSGRAKANGFPRLEFTLVTRSYSWAIDESETTVRVVESHSFFEDGHSESAVVVGSPRFVGLLGRTRLVF
jgi:hypothetical protein